MLKYDKLITDMIKYSTNVVKQELKYAHSCLSTQTRLSLINV